MEIQRYLEKYKTHSPKEFYDRISRGRTMELRFLKDRYGNKFSNFNLIKQIAEELKIEYRFNSLFINSYSEMIKVLFYEVNGSSLTMLFNIFISVNPRKKIYVKSKNGLVYKAFSGSIAGTSHIQNIGCDIEHRLRGMKKEEIVKYLDDNKIEYTEKQVEEYSQPSSSEAMLEECIQGALYLVKLHNLTDYYINISGNGVHLWIILEEEIELPEFGFTELADKIKYNLKDDRIYSWVKTYNRFVEKIDRELQEFNPKLKVDEGAKDLSRVLRPVASWNVKAGKLNRCCGTVTKDNLLPNIIIKKFLAARPILNKEQKIFHSNIKTTNKYRYNHLNISESPIVKLLLSRFLPSTLSRNHYLEQSLARLLRDNQINLSDISTLIGQIDITQRKNVQVDPDYLGDDLQFSPEPVNSYCIGCKIDLVYNLLDEYPDVKEGYITDEHYLKISGITEKSLDVMLKEVIGAYTKPNNYIELKTLVRTLVDKHDKTTVLFILKKLYLDEWEYYHNNRVFLQLLNKTRRKNG